MADTALEFLAAARGFRTALGAEDVEERGFARDLRNAVARVYLAAALLGSPGRAESDDDPPNERPAAGEREALVDRLRSRLRQSDVFVDVYDPTGIVDEDRKPIERSLAQELVEIDEDLRDAIAWLEQDVPDALWQVRFAFEQHWGSHAVACLRPLHQLATYGVV